RCPLWTLSVWHAWNVSMLSPKSEVDKGAAAQALFDLWRGRGLRCAPGSSEGMTIRGFMPATQRGYLRVLADFTAFSAVRRGRPVPKTCGATRCTGRNGDDHERRGAFRFFFGVTLSRKDAQTA